MIWSRLIEVIKTEEKGSDVALDALLVAHGYPRRYEAAIVVSNRCFYPKVLPAQGPARGGNARRRQCFRAAPGRWTSVVRGELER